MMTVDDVTGYAYAASTTKKMEAETIKSFLPDLVTAVSDSVLPVSDQCLAKGLISDTVYKRVSESVGTREDNARTLIIAVKNTIENDGQCFELFLSILNETLPYRVKSNLLTRIKKTFMEKSSGAIIPVTDQSTLTATEISKECFIQQETHIGQFEGSVRQHAQACTEKELLKQSLEKQTKEIERLRKELESQVSDKESNNAATQERLAMCESEVTEMRERIAKLESVIEERGMKLKRKRNIMMFGIKALLSNQEREMNKRDTIKDETTLDEATGSSVSTLEASLKAMEEQMKQERAQQEQRFMDLEKKLLDQEKQLEVRGRQAKGGIVLSANYTPLHEPLPDPDSSIYDVPTLDSILKRYYSEKFYDKWQDIGIMLQIDYTILDDIKGKDRDPKQCLYILYNVWLRRNDPLPTRNELYKATEKLGLQEY